MTTLDAKLIQNLDATTAAVSALDEQDRQLQHVIGSSESWKRPSTPRLASCSRYAVERTGIPWWRITNILIESVRATKPWRSRLAVDLKRFDAIAATAGQSADGSFQVQDFREIGADPLLLFTSVPGLERIVGFLAAMSVVEEVDRDIYTSTPLAASYVSSSPLSAAVIHSSPSPPPLLRLPPHPPLLRPSLQHRHGDALPPAWPGLVRVLPVTARLRVSHETDPLLVDIGGGQGEDLKRLRHQFPDLRGRLILQDLPTVIAGATDLPADIEAQSHDFFQPQPVKNAKGYFMRRILHDWPDKQAAQILGHVQ
ncbi:uncharacterized protein N7482_008292 [Penicillium canariense]|uniref:O-methyltransferase C-terminal domain-containing protein n=1 Tax=Penicillium canariense TaxID=189055 RepID=A0A9W9HVG6_9EURO|nr:uncharacterized protein N7482_008292 [Penicillium canariense]KAJ5157192.1 hypothetical protein N7482_008292 [Penicillium canariense]